MDYIDALKEYVPYNEQEAWDKKIMIDTYDELKDHILDRTSYLAHMTCSSMILNETHDKVLMVYHNIYDSYSWTGGHADGEKDLLSVALREANEETGITGLKVISDHPFSIEILHVPPHFKKGKFVNAHLHMNLSYLFEADENLPIRIKADENKDVKWIRIDELEQYVTEKDMLPTYHKLLRNYELNM